MVPANKVVTSEVSSIEAILGVIQSNHAPLLKKLFAICSVWTVVSCPFTLICAILYCLQIRAEVQGVLERMGSLREESQLEVLLLAMALANLTH